MKQDNDVKQAKMGEVQIS